MKLLHQIGANEMESQNDNYDNDTPENCYYAGNPSMNDCNQLGYHYVKMSSKNAKPKYRCVCWECFKYLIDENLATICIDE